MQVTIKDSGDLKKLAKDLRQAANGKQLRKEFTKAVKAELAPVVREIRAGYLAAPSGGHESWGPARRREPPLRSMLAKATTMQVRTSGKQAGVSVKVAGKKMPSGYRGLPKAYEQPTGAKPWRHPVYGDRTTWVAQSRPRRVFDPTVEPHVPRVTAAVDRVADEVARRLERPGGSA